MEIASQRSCALSELIIVAGDPRSLHNCPATQWIHSGTFFRGPTLPRLYALQRP